VRIASSHAITTCATLAAIVLFVGLSSQIVPVAITGMELPDSASLVKVALLLNIAIILFGWRRSKDLGEALQAYEEAERSARRNANSDSITGLANRRELVRALSEAVEGRAKGALLLLDLDHFKRVNDLHGHFVGDELLRSVAGTLNRAAPDGDCVARMGGDEFAILLTGVRAADAEQAAESIVAELREPVEIERVKVYVSASIGIAALMRSAALAVRRRRAGCSAGRFRAKRFALSSAARIRPGFRSVSPPVHARPAGPSDRAALPLRLRRKPSRRESGRVF
jgi:diguanylate cyclase (GGDEF)-like protein